MFDLSRFLRLARAQWSEQRRAWLWFLGILVMLHFVLLLLTVSLAKQVGEAHSLSHGGQEGTFMLGLFVTAPIFAARYFQGMARPESAGVLLMRPASLAEKWLLAACVVLVAYPLAYALVFQILNVPAALYVQAAHEALLAKRALENEPEVLRSFAEFRLFLPWHAFDDWLGLLSLSLVLATLQGFAVLGSVYFRTMPFIKTVLVAFVLLLMTMLVSGIADGNPDALFSYWDGEAPAGWLRVFLPLAWFGIPGFLWLACLFALREREVA